MENVSLGVSVEITLDPFFIPTGGRYFIFFLGLVIYLFAAFCNLTLLALIILQESLHTPMYFILFSLPLIDFIGLSAMLPKVLSDIVTETNKVYYPLCILQGFLLHMYGGAIVFILAAMAFDRYIAICEPLRYNTVMTPRNVTLIITMVWGIDFVLVFLLFSLHINISWCNTAIKNVFCDNPSLLKLSCGNTNINNVVGLLCTAVFQLSSIFIQIFSYVKILLACMVTRKSEAKSKAVSTCVGQLVIFIMFEIVAIFTILFHRFTKASSDLQKIMGTLIFLIPPFLNPIVYGLNTSEIRNTLLKVFKKKVGQFKQLSS